MTKSQAHRYPQDDAIILELGPGTPANICLFVPLLHWHFQTKEDVVCMQVTPDEQEAVKELALRLEGTDVEEQLRRCVCMKTACLMLVIIWQF